MANPFLAEIRIFSGNFAPAGWAFCNGQILAISQNTALFSLLGTTYGGNGTSNFALPNLQGCAPLGAGQGNGLSSYIEGETGGEVNHTLLATEVPAHSHGFNAGAGGRGNNNTVTGESPANTSSGVNVYSNATASATMHPSMLGATTSGAHENSQPFLGLNFIIAMQGVFPTRN
jgi:microcystin-dependent protein